MGTAGPVRRLPQLCLLPPVMVLHFRWVPGDGGRSGARTHPGTAALLAAPFLVGEHCLPARGPRCPGQRWGCQGEIHSRAQVASSPGCDALTGRCPPHTLLGVHAPGPHGDSWRSGRSSEHPAHRGGDRSGRRPTWAILELREQGPELVAGLRPPGPWPLPTTVRFGSG